MAAEDKRGSKKEKKEREGEGLKKALGKIAESGISQFVSDFTRPAVERIPLGILKTLGRFQVHKFISFLSVAIVSALPKGKIWADKLGDFLNELTAELRQRIVKVMEGVEEPAVKVDKKAAVGAIKTIFKVLFAPELADSRDANLQTLDNIMSSRPAKEEAVICEILGGMSEHELAMFFDWASDKDKAGLDLYFKRFIKPEEKKKTFSEIVAELKRDIHEFGEGKQVTKELAQEVWTVVVKPVLKSIDNRFAEGGIIHNQVSTFHQKTTSFRERARAFRGRQRNA